MINYINQGATYNLKGKRAISKWIKEVINIFDPSLNIGSLSIVFCDDEYILDINKRFLDHNYYTDIITFDYCEGDTVSGDLIISIDTVKSNAVNYNVLFTEEMHRVIIHGILHLIGFNDSNSKEIAQMRRAEDKAIALLKDFSTNTKDDK